MSLNLRVTIAKGIPCKVSSTSRGVQLCTLNLVLILFVSVSPYILDGLVLLPRRKMHTPLNLASVASASYPSLAPAEFCTTSPHRRYQNIFCEWSSSPLNVATRKNGCGEYQPTYYIVCAPSIRHVIGKPFLISGLSSAIPSWPALRKKRLKACSKN